MIYIILGDDLRLIEYRNLLEKLKIEDKKIYDGQFEEEWKSFIEDISSYNLFSSNKLIILKRAHEIKELESIIKNLKNLKIEKEVIIDIEDPEEKIVKKLEKVIGEDKRFILTYIKDDRNNSKKISYISRKLKLNKDQALEIFEMIGPSIYNIENEIQKIELTFQNKNYSFEDMKKIISKNPKDNILENCELLLDNKKELLNKNIEFLLFLYTLSTFLKLCLKIKLLENEIKFTNNYFDFNKNIYPKIKNRIDAHPYFIFKNLERSFKTSLEKLEKNIFEIVEIEYELKLGKLNDKEAVNKLIINF